MLDAHDITSRELTEIIAFYRLEPTVGHRLDHMTAQLSYVTAQSGFGKSSADIDDFRPKWGKPRQPSNEEILEMFRQAQS